MNLNIETLNKLTEQHYKLLLEADPNEKLISKYLNRSFCFEATYNNELLGVLVLLPTHPETLEVVNIAVISTQRNKGIGHQLLTFAEKYARNNNYSVLKLELVQLASDNFIFIKNVISALLVLIKISLQFTMIKKLLKMVLF